MTGNTNGGNTNGDVEGGSTPSGNRWEPAPGSGSEPATPPLTAHASTASYPVTDESEGGPASLRGLLSHWKLAAAGALLVVAGGAGGFAVGHSVSGDQLQPVSFGRDGDRGPGVERDADGPDGGPGLGQAPPGSGQLLGGDDDTSEGTES